MRCSAWSSLAISVCSALVAAAPAAAHVTMTPPFLAAGETATLSLTGPNERDAPMTGFQVTAPPAFRILHVHSAQGWESGVMGSTATWSGRSLAPGSEASFTLHVEVPDEPGPAVFAAAQLYPGGAAVHWRVPFTITPSTESPSQNPAWVVGIVAVMLLAITVAGVVLLRRRRSLQER